ncbi:integrin alpha-L-like [Chrysemys picta bellii]|uniref:integrin alpha-L-like n=1 Tax=Chrysemys picta bellii TaxID=8478 RepID=UPI0032B2A10F
MAVKGAVKEGKEMSEKYVTHPHAAPREVMAPDPELRPLLVALLTLNLLRGLAPSQAFSIETHNATVFEGDADVQFGYRVVQMRSNDSSWLVVSAPLAGNGTGALYRCSYHAETCQPIPLPDTPLVSLGLALASDEISGSRVIACGPRLQQRCEENVYLQGLCYVWGGWESPPRVLRPAGQECISGVDVAILYDDSLSIQPNDFTLMKQFIGKLLRALAGPRVQIAVVQFSSYINHVFTFADYVAKGLEAVEQDLMAFPHLKGNTHTPSAILFTVKQTFTPEHGARSHINSSCSRPGASCSPKLRRRSGVQAGSELPRLRTAPGSGRHVPADPGREGVSTRCPE